MSNPYPVETFNDLYVLMRVPTRDLPALLDRGLQSGNLDYFILSAAWCGALGQGNPKRAELLAEYIEKLVHTFKPSEAK